MNRILKVTRLHLNKLGSFAVTPPAILAVVMVVSVVIAVVIQRASGVSTPSADYIEGARYNSGVVWSLPGFLIYYGVQAVSTTYPFGLALGTTRRNFILGTVIANAIQSAYVTLLLLALLGLELATGHWFIGVYVLDTYALGAGNPGILAATGFLGTLCCLTVGGVFGAVWVRFGPKGPMLLGFALALVVVFALFLLAPRLGEIVASLTGGGVALGAAVATVLALVGTWFAMRRASVR